MINSLYFHCQYVVPTCFWLPVDPIRYLNNSLIFPSFCRRLRTLGCKTTSLRLKYLASWLQSVWLLFASLDRISRRATEGRRAEKANNAVCIDPYLKSILNELGWCQNDIADDDATRKQRSQYLLSFFTDETESLSETDRNRMLYISTCSFFRVCFHVRNIHFADILMISR